MDCLARVLAMTLSVTVACSAGDDGSDGESSDAGTSGAGSDDGASQSDDGGTGSGGGSGDDGGTSGTDGGMCAPLDEVCFDDDMGGENPVDRACCDDSFCDIPQCTDSEPAHCRSFCACLGDGQECLQVTDGNTVTDKPCCGGFECTDCMETEKGMFCVCRAP